MERNSGRSKGKDYLLAIGIVSYHYKCLEDEKRRLGKDFVWSNEMRPTSWKHALAQPQVQTGEWREIPE